jgi:hypothetical protein
MHHRSSEQILSLMHKRANIISSEKTEVEAPTQKSVLKKVSKPKEASNLEKGSFAGM